MNDKKMNNLTILITSKLVTSNFRSAHGWFCFCMDLQTHDSPETYCFVCSSFAARVRKCRFLIHFSFNDPVIPTKENACATLSCRWFFVPSFLCFGMGKKIWYSFVYFKTARTLVFIPYPQAQIYIFRCIWKSCGHGIIGKMMIDVVNPRIFTPSHHHHGLG